MLAIRYLTIVFVQVLPSQPAITPSSGTPSSVSSASDWQMLLHNSFIKPLGFMPGSGPKAKPHSICSLGDPELYVGLAMLLAALQILQMQLLLQSFGVGTRI